MPSKYMTVIFRAVNALEDTIITLVEEIPLLINGGV
jgi:hypothetical protein